MNRKRPRLVHNLMFIPVLITIRHLMASDRISDVQDVEASIFQPSLLRRRPERVCCCGSYSDKTRLFQMNNPAAPNSRISASLRQATGYQTENIKRPKGRGIKP